MNVLRLLIVATIVAGSTGFAEAKQARSHFYDQRPAQEEGLTTGRSVGGESPASSENDWFTTIIQENQGYSK
ncbi:MAG: hypothetical protein WDN46_22675 [Methylocella sp.]